MHSLVSNNEIEFISQHGLLKDSLFFLLYFQLSPHKLFYNDCGRHTEMNNY